jgi:hypothetical protein
MLSRARSSCGLVCLVALLAVALLASAAPSFAQQAASPYGVLVNDVKSWSEIGPRMDVAVGVGAGWVRIDFIWAWVEGSAGSFNWTYFDTIVNEADARGLRVVGILWGTPSWAGPSVYGPPTDLTRWDTFVAQTAARYRGKGIVWEVWNEPDTWYWKGTPAQYAELLARAYARIKAADPGATVALGGLAQGGSSAIADFLARILADSVYPAGRYFDLHNVHTNFRTPSMIATQLSSNRATLAAYGLDKPIIVTEARRCPITSGADRPPRRATWWTSTTRCSATASHSRCGRRGWITARTPERTRRAGSWTRAGSRNRRTRHTTT